MGIPAISFAKDRDLPNALDAMWQKYKGID